MGSRVSIPYQARYKGYTDDQFLPLQRFDFSSAQWSSVSPVRVDPEPEEKRYFKELTCYGGVCSTVLGNCAYTFGGFWKYGYAVHELNLETMVWRRLEPQNREDGPMRKSGAGIVTCGDEGLCVFGGCGCETGPHTRQLEATYHSDTVNFPENSWTNELHIFSLTKGAWSSPETTGPRPPPCAGFSFTNVDFSHAVLYGGKQRHKRVNEVHILDIKSWHWSGAILPTSPADLWPQERSLHSACALVDPKFYTTTVDSFKSVPQTQSHIEIHYFQLQPNLFVLGGTGNSSIQLVADAWILDVNNITWSPVTLQPALGQPRSSFSLGCHNHSPSEAEIVVFGGLSKMSGHRSTSKTQSGTTLLYLGVMSLYHLCVEYVAESYEFSDSLLQRLLPSHINNTISQQKNKKANILEFGYQVVQL